ncbi:MAG TPA: ribonuclease J [Desulfobacteraceae bacterium]|nr:ribonuclease J [Desulfobacteraceae bacterium]HPJ66789.1 ribonuclease J [Desulfobacteraceae bacterium]HPQ26999.1 ribonuclease J [Desulfobacteraceae bacterium]
MLKIIPLGGLGEIGLNMMAVEYEQYLIVIDAGLMFPDDYMPGIDFVIPDLQYLRENRDKVKALILTHGHEDHIGAVPFFLKEFFVPVFGTGFTLELLKQKLREHDLPEEPDLKKISAGESTSLGPFRIEYISVNHSIVDGVGLAIETPEGIIVHSGDFRLDPTPVDGQSTDLIRFAHYGAKGVLVLFSDSTNAEKEGFTLSESAVRKTLRELFQTSQGRVIVSSFASNITRIQQVIDLAVEFDRKLVLSGKSMVTNIRLAREQGFISMPDGLEISERQIGMFPDENIAIITTGSQGEPMSALTRMAHGHHKTIKIKPNDKIILSSRFIPGNENAITSIINSFYHMGADVVYEKVSDIHTSGHAKREELKVMLSLVKPRYFVPIHGEYRHLVKHAQLALEMGMPENRVLIAEDGKTICFKDNEVSLGEAVNTGRVLVDGKGVGDVEEVVLRDRKRLSGDGIVVVLLAVNEHSGEIIFGPDIVSRGFVIEEHGGLILDSAKTMVLEVLADLERPSSIDWLEVKADIYKRLKRFFYNIINRSPLILPIVIPM